MPLGGSREQIQWALLALTLGLAPSTASGPLGSLGVQVVERCRRYVTSPAALQYCVMNEAGAATTVAQLQRLCADAGDLQSDCLRQWVNARVPPDAGWSTDQLLAACGSSEDCRLSVLDARPAATVDQQLAVCTRYAGQYAEDCASHALQRWAWLEPDVYDIEQLAWADSGYPLHVGNLVAAAVVCRGLPTCVGRPDVVEACVRQVDILSADARRCSQYVRPEPVDVPVSQGAPW